MQCFTIFRALCEVTKVTKPPVKPLCVKDLLLLCQMFYLPADHGQFGLELLNEFYWLKRNGTAMLPLGKYKVYYLFNILTNKQTIQNLYVCTDVNLKMFTKFTTT